MLFRSFLIVRSVDVPEIVAPVRDTFEPIETAVVFATKFEPTEYEAALIP